MPGTFVTLSTERLAALKTATTPDEWTALMPESSYLDTATGFPAARL